jgi:hypothetical protein
MNDLVCNSNVNIDYKLVKGVLKISENLRSVLLCPTS